MPKVRLRYQTLEFEDLDIHLRTLRDTQQFSDEQQEAEALGISSASWPHFGVLWDSGLVLARLMLTQEVNGLRVLEVGCGIGLASIVLSARNAQITATDHHPEAGRFLAINARLNNLAPIAFVLEDWTAAATALGQYDLLIGSDLLYESWHAEQLASFIDRHAATGCRVIIVDPGRGVRGRFTQRMIALGFNHDSSAKADAPSEGKYKGQVLTFSRAPPARESAFPQ